MGRLQYQKTGRTFSGLTATRQNYSVSSARSSFGRSVKKTRKLSSLMGRGCSAHSYCRMSTPWHREVMKKLIVICYCTYHTLSVPGSPPNNWEHWTRDVMCSTNVPCFDRLLHCIQLCWSQKEDSMIIMEVTAGTDRCTIGVLADIRKEIP